MLARVGHALARARLVPLAAWPLSDAADSGVTAQDNGKGETDVQLGTSSPPDFSAEWRAIPTNEPDLRQAARSPDGPVFDHLKLIAFRGLRIAEVHHQR